ncbi:hypothetical protein [Lysobacter gummosus]|uniref:hypothetical protein n=1 Tax=Lysobacter gummosus TaxID=262324 RepID=UPI0036258C98
MRRPVPGCESSRPPRADVRTAWPPRARTARAKSNTKPDPRIAEVARAPQAGPNSTAADDASGHESQPPLAACAPSPRCLFRRRLRHGLA